ncbi:MAG: GIY-YIG nuclease family protein [Pseudomonadota bacterium]
MSKEHRYFTYLLASGHYGTLYVGMTNDLARRVQEHKEGKGGSFTRRYGINQLMWFEQHGDVEVAIAREKAIKKWRRQWKVRLIETDNPRWMDLSGEIGL